MNSAPPNVMIAIIKQPCRKANHNTVKPFTSYSLSEGQLKFNLYFAKLFPLAPEKDNLNNFV